MTFSNSSEMHRPCNQFTPSSRWWALAYLSVRAFVRSFGSLSCTRTKNRHESKLLITARSKPPGAVDGIGRTLLVRIHPLGLFAFVSGKMTTAPGSAWFWIS